MIKLGHVTVSLELREAYKDGQTVRLGSRAFDILELLIAARGKVVSKDELLSRIWPDTVVEENNLQVHVSALRKALGDGREIIRTVAGRGYRLLMDADTVAALPPPGVPGCCPSVADDPALIGRESLLAQLLETLNRSRVLTLIGAGGVGKTTLARALGTRLQAQHNVNVRFVSLENLQCADLLVEAVACALRVDCSEPGTIEPAIMARFKDQRWLLILDSCEHLVDAVARFCERILQFCPSVTLLTTSRESLRISGETIVSVPGLDVPFTCVSPQQVLLSGSVSLFLERAGALASVYRQDPASLEHIASLCHHLDGLPLAIEMAASRVSFLGLSETLAQVQARPHGLSGSSRTAAPRHQTLQASLDISYQALDSAERHLLSHLVRLTSGFSFAQACDGAAAAGLSVESLIEGISGLISKSWLGLCQTWQRYWLSGIARSYLLEKYAQNTEPELTSPVQPGPRSGHAISTGLAALWAPDVLQRLYTALPLCGVEDQGQPLSLSGVIMDSAIAADPGVVYIVDDEQSVRVALDRLLRSAGFKATGFASAEDFLREPVEDRPACLLLDVNLASDSGFDLQLELSRRGSHIPIIFMTGFGTIPLSVKAMKAGAHEFLTKPFNDEQLLDSIRAALLQDSQRLQNRLQVSRIWARYETLTPREREVLPLLLDGKRNCEIAVELGTREITSKVHRKHIMTKMAAGSLLELVRICAQLRIGSVVTRPGDP